MVISTKKLAISLIAGFFAICIAAEFNPTSAAGIRTREQHREPERDYRNPHLPTPQIRKLQEVDFPEYYIDPTLQQGMKLILPETSNKKFTFSGGYDRWEGLPTLKLDCYIPIQSWWDRSAFLSPRVSLDGSRESLSVTGGFRRLLGPNALLSLHVFHDWVRSRRPSEAYLREAGAGIEFSALPGRHSDLTLSFNAYVPVNDRISVIRDGSAVLRERLPIGYDAKLEFQFPSIVDWLDIKLNGKVHSLRGDKLNLGGYTACLSMNTRNGLFKASFEQEMDARRGEGFKVQGSVNFVFDWKELLDGRMPLSAPYRVSEYRFTRSLRDSLHQRVTRRYDLPADRVEKEMTLAARVSDQTVIFNGGFPHLPNATVTVQVSQSPWQDRLDVITDASGSFVGKLDLPPGTYQMRLIHKPSGLVSGVKTVVVNDPETTPDASLSRVAQ